MSADDNNSRDRPELVGAIEDYLAAWHAFTHDLVSPREAAEEVLAMAFRGTNLRIPFDDALRKLLKAPPQHKTAKKKK